MMNRPWLQPPRLRISEVDEGERHATWLEIFYDLIFVAVIAQLSEGLSEELSIAGLVYFLILFVPVWWSWVGAAFFATRFDTDDTIHRLLVLLQMIAILAMGANIRDGLARSSDGFAISYAVARLLLVAEYLRAGYFVPEARQLTGRFSKGFAAAAIIWLASAFVPIPMRFGLWAIGFAVDLGTPVFAGQLHSVLAPHAGHLPERFGQFTLIVIGESVAGAAAAISEHVWHVSSAATAGLGICAAFGMWWIYSDSIAGTAIQVARESGRVLSYQIWLYSHLPLTIGLAAIGVGTTQAVLMAPQHISEAARWLTFGAFAVCFISLAAIHITTAAPGLRLRKEMGAISRVVMAAIMIFFAIGLMNIPPPVLTGILTLSCAIMIVIDFYERQRHEREA